MRSAESRGLQPDVVHIQYQSAAYGLHPAVNYLPLWLHTLPGRPRVVTTFHDLRFPYLFPKAGPLRWQTVLALAKHSDAAVITNPADWLRLAQAGLRDRLHPIPIGSNIQCEPPSGYDAHGSTGEMGCGAGYLAVGLFRLSQRRQGGRDADPLSG